MSLHSKGALTPGKVPKLRSTAEKTKVELRRLVLDHMKSRRAPTRVFDAFAGHGAMYHDVWRRADDYVACDFDWWRDDRLAFACDNRRAMRAIDLSRFTIFDFDSFGPPWEQVYILCRRRPLRAGEIMGVVLTEGSGLALRAGAKPTSFYWFAKKRTSIEGGTRNHDEMIDAAIATFAELMGGKVTARWQASQEKGGHMRYISLIIERPREVEKIAGTGA